MPEYDVTIKACVIKTITVEADTEEAAEEQAHQLFNPNVDDTQEEYTQETVETKLVQ